MYSYYMKWKYHYCLIQPCVGESFNGDEPETPHTMGSCRRGREDFSFAQHKHLRFHPLSRIHGKLRKKMLTWRSSTKQPATIIATVKDQTREQWSHATTQVAVTNGFIWNVCSLTPRLPQELGTAQIAKNSGKGREKELNTIDIALFNMLQDFPDV